MARTAAEAAPTLRCRRGFTFVEMMFGLIFTCMVLGALAALTAAMTGNWREDANKNLLPGAQQTGGTQFSSLQRLDYADLLVKNAKYLGWAGRKSNGVDSAVVLWASDDTQTGTMENSEVRVLEFSAANQTLSMLYVPSTASNAGNKATLTLLYDDTNGRSDVTSFENTTGVTSQVLLRNVVDFAPKVVLNPVDASQRPALEYVLKVNQGDGTVCRYQTTCLRAPAAAPQ